MTKTKTPKLYWYDKIQKLKDGKLTWFELVEMSRKAGDWTTCACGELDPLIPRRPAGVDENAPVDYELKEYGMLLWRLVRSLTIDVEIEGIKQTTIVYASPERISDIENTIDAIQQRAILLLNEIAE